ncbi:MAG: TfuA-like protein [Burkholderiales bacterium]
MNACIFAGPSLPPQEDARKLEVMWLPPAKHGDVHRAVSLLRPRAIGIVDGYFQWTPSVWHKEILWALQQGVHVFGAASMGALRAAELAPFGMRGVGRIFEAYRDGVLAGCGDAPFEDDDEVAVIHGPAESGYLAASEAMVDIRCTLADAGRAGVIAGTTQARLLVIAKGLYFPERGYAHLLEQARAAALPAAELAALQDWLPAGRVRQKRADALLMIETLRTFLARDPAPFAAGFTFEHTTLWARAFAGARTATMHDAEETQALEELRLDAARWDAVRREALRSLLALKAPPLAAAAQAEAVRRPAEDIPATVVERQMLAQIRASGEFERLRARAEDKRARLASRRDLPAMTEFSDLKLLELRDWYFSQVLQGDMPDDLEGWLQSAGYADPPQFHGAVFHEFVYRQMTGAEQAV